MGILTLIVITLAISLFLNLLLKKINISPIVGYILTGFLISLGVKNTENIDPHILSELAEFGIVFLMFTIGLEFSLHHMKSMKKEVFVFGTLQVILTAIFFTVMANNFFGIDLKTSIIIGSALSLSSTAIVLKVLNENGDIHRPYGRYSLGILLFQDLAVIPILLMISFFSSSATSISDLLINTILSGAVVIFILFVVGKYLTTKFLEYVVDTKTEELFIIGILLLVLSASLLAHSFGFSYSLGAFIAGMLIAETKYKYQIEADLVPFRDILLGLFFITVGMQMNLQVVLDNYLIIAGLTVVILLAKAIMIYLIVVSFSYFKRAIKTALALAQVGEFSFAVFALAKSNELIEDEILQILLAVVVVSLIFTSIVIRYVRPFTDYLFKEPDPSEATPMVSAGADKHIIVCGYSLLGQQVVQELKIKGISYVAIEHERNHVKEGLDRGDSVLFGNAASKTMLNSVDVKKATAVIIAIDNDERIRLICEAIHAIDKNIDIILKYSHEEQKKDFEDLDIKAFINEHEMLSRVLVYEAIKCEI